MFTNGFLSYRNDTICVLIWKGLHAINITKMFLSGCHIGDSAFPNMILHLILFVKRISVLLQKWTLFTQLRLIIGYRNVLGQC